RGKGEYTTPQTAPWNLGRWGPWINIVAIIWVVFVTIIFVLPPNELVLWTMLLLGALLLVYWFGFARQRFAGPTPADEAALRRLEAEVEGQPAAVPLPAEG